MKKLWLLSRLAERVDCDTDFAHVVVADSVEDARQLARAGGRGRDDDWLNATITACDEVDMSVANVILTANTGS